MLKLKLQSFGHLMQRTDSLEKTLMLGKIEGRIKVKETNTFKSIEVTQSCPTVCNHVDCSLPGSSFHGIFQARVLEWLAFSVSRESFQPRDRTQVSHIAGRRFTI